jgi:hypothetical protein
MHALESSCVGSDRGHHLKFAPEVGRQISDARHDRIDSSLALGMVTAVMDGARTA